jgi:chaperonin GroES
MATYRALGNRLIVQLDKPKEQTPGGIILPDSAQRKAMTGRVVSVGPGMRIAFNARGDVQAGELPRYPLEVQVGDLVAFGDYAGSPLPDTDEYWSLREDEIMAVIEP